VSARLAIWLPYPSLTCGFAFRHSAGACFNVVHARQLTQGLRVQLSLFPDLTTALFFCSVSLNQFDQLPNYFRTTPPWKKSPQNLMFIGFIATSLSTTSQIFKILSVNSSQMHCSAFVMLASS